jgi:hypothetical protein
MNNNNQSESTRKLVDQIDWELQKRRPFVVADPFQPESLLYLTERDYQVLMRTCLSNNEYLLVVARPGSKPPETTDTSKVRSSNFFVLGRSFSKKEGLVYLTKRNFSLVYRSYLDYLYFLKRKPVQPTLRYQTLLISRLFHLWNVLGNEKFVKYLKVSLYAVYSYIGDKPLVSTDSQDVKVRLSNSLPAFLPALYRREIRNGNKT